MVSGKGRSFEEAVFADLGGDVRSEGLHGGAEVADQARVFGVGRVGVHVAVRLEALEVRADVVEGGVGQGGRLGMVAAPEPSSRVKDAGCGNGKWKMENGKLSIFLSKCLQNSRKSYTFATETQKI